MAAFSTGQRVAVQPVSQSGPWSMSGAVAATQSGSWVVGLAAGTSVSIGNLPATQTVAGSVSVSNLPAVQPVSLSGQSVAATQSGPWSVSVSGTATVAGAVSISNFPATQPVSWTGQSIAATQSGPWSISVSGTATIAGAVSITNLPATQAVTQSGTWSVSVANQPTVQAVSLTGQSVAATQSGTWAVSVSNLPSTQAVSGSVSIANLPATQPVSGSVSVANFPATQPVTFSGQSVVATQSGAWSVSVAGSTTIQGGNSTAVYVREPSIRSVGALGLAGSAGVIVTATVAGGMIFTFADGSTMPVYAPLGTTVFRMVPTSIAAGAIGSLLAATINSSKSFSES